MQARQAHVGRREHVLHALEGEISRMVKPNFESSHPVRMYWCVSASTPGVMRR